MNRECPGCEAQEQQIKTGRNRSATQRILCRAGGKTFKDKSETYSVEGGNADLRHYLAGSQRASRCFSRCFKALSRAVELFVYFYNERQLREKRLPKYQAHPAQNLPTLI